MSDLKLLNEDEKQSPPSLAFNPDDYRHHITEFDLTLEQQNELLETLWHIMSTMVNIGWGVDNIQLMLPELFNSESEADIVNTQHNTKGKDKLDAR